MSLLSEERDQKLVKTASRPELKPLKNATLLAMLKTPTHKKRGAPYLSRKAYGLTITPEERHCMIAEAAYYRAVQRGMSGGDPMEDWLAAERDIDWMLSGIERTPR